MKKTFLIALFLIPLFALSQDVVVMKNGEKLDCKITKVDSLNVYYTFQKGDRNVNSYISKNEIRGYQYSNKTDSIESIKISPNLTKGKYVAIDTTVYHKITEEWVDMITISKKLGINANG